MNPELYEESLSPVAASGLSRLQISMTERSRESMGSRLSLRAHRTSQQLPSMIMPVFNSVCVPFKYMLY